MFWLLASTNLIAAGLVFTVQPLVSKLALPQFGGSAMVWSTALMVFQGGLLLGYLYAHALSKVPSAAIQALIHTGTAALSLLFLPLVFTPLSTDLHPSWVLTLSLCACVGLPYFVVCTTSPLTQRWYLEWTRGNARDPYLLYSASNIGSLLALLGYPFLIEPLLDTDVQRSLWSWGYAALLLVLFAFMLARHRTRASHLRITTAADAAQQATWHQRSRWVVFAFVPSLYLMGVTLHISIDIAAAPFVWVLPLALYLLSFIILFAKPSWGTHSGVLTAQACAVIALCIYFFYSDLIFLLVIHLVGLFLACMVCHGRLVAIRPPASNLTEFYIWMAFGGWLGGFVGSLIAPVAFTGNWEYLLAIAGTCLLRPTQTEGSLWADLLAAAGLALLLLALVALTLLFDWESYVLFALFVVVVYVFRRRPIRFALAVIPLLVGNQIVDNDFVFFRDRSFYGIYEIGPDESGALKQLTHGTTLHGAQIAYGQNQTLPLAYYNREGPLGQVIAEKRNAGSLNSVGVIGLGVATIACYALPHTRMTFFEIDPLIVSIAQAEFSYLDKCAPEASIIIGDGRLSLEQSVDESFDVLVVDAFSSDAIPLHLLTAEAMRLYLNRLRPEGVLLFHISNRYVDLSGVLAHLATANDAAAFVQYYEPAEAEQNRAAASSDWVWIAHGATAKPMGENWQPLRADPDRALWTDRYSNLLGVVAWQKVLWF